MYEEKNKRKVYYDRIDPEVLSDMEKDYKKSLLRLELKPVELIMLRPPCVDETSAEDLTKLSISIHHDGVDKNLRGMTVAHMYVDDFYYNLPEPPETDVVDIIQSVDYDRLKAMLDVRRHIHYLDSWGSRYLDLDELKEERNNDSVIGKVHYSSSVSDSIGMLSTRYNKTYSARRCRKRHRK